MFSLHSCKYPNCHKQALSHFDAHGNLIEESAFCLEHDPNPEETVQAIFDYIAKHDKIIGLTMPGITFENMDLSQKRFYGCDMQACSFFNVHSEYCQFRMDMLDFATFSDCNLLNSNMQFTSFAGSTFSHVLFTNSDLVHNNFNGIISHQSSFDDSDLYNSRFIRAELVDTSLRNCNIKKTIFFDANFSNVSFKQSNTREAMFSQDAEKHGLVL